MDIAFNVPAVAGLIALVCTIVGLLWKLFKYNSETARRITEIERKAATHEKDISQLMRCSMATLGGLKELGCNGIVTETYKEIGDHLTRRGL